MTREELKNHPNIHIEGVDDSLLDGIHIESPDSSPRFRDMRSDSSERMEKMRAEQAKRFASRKAGRQGKRRGMTADEIRRNPNIHIDADSMEGIHIESPDTDSHGMRDHDDLERSYERMREERRRRAMERDAERERMLARDDIPEYHIGDEGIGGDSDSWRASQAEHIERLRRMREERMEASRRELDGRELAEEDPDEDIFERARRIADEAHRRAREQHQTLRARHEEMMREHQEQMQKFRTKHAEFMTVRITSDSAPPPHTKFSVYRLVSFVCSHA